VMICHTMSAQVGAIEQVVQAVKKGELSQDAIQASVERVKDLKASVCVSSYDDSPTWSKSMSLTQKNSSSGLESSVESALVNSSPQLSDC
jgi:hypothetical protein